MPISPNQGPTSGGTTVTITGVNLANTFAVHFGSNSATITANTPTMVTVIAPSGDGAVDVTVTTGGGDSNPLTFYYIPPPIFTSLSIESGPTAGGNIVNLFGRYLETTTSCNFGSNTATPTIIGDGQLSVVVPAGTAAGAVSVSITTGGGTTSQLTYTYIDAPTISTVSPSSGPTAGGTSVTITGTNLSTTTSITFGGTVASFGTVSSTTLVAVTPPGTAGAADVVVTTTGGSATAVGGYTYTAGPGI